MSERTPFTATELGAAYDRLRLPVTVLLEDVRSMYNVGSFFRSGDGAGIESIYLSGITARPPKKQLSKTALGAEEHVRWYPSENSVETVRELHKRGYEIAAIET